MRRPHVYERSATRATRPSRIEAAGDYGPAARAAVVALPELLRQAEAVGAVTLARHLGQALSEAEGIVKRSTAAGERPRCEPSGSAGSDVDDAGAAQA